jgi:Uma2 family endonuclease
MRDPLAAHTLTLDEYIRLDERSPIRHEFVAGEVYALSGATARHGRIAGNIFSRLFAAARGTPCSVFMNGMRLQVSADVYYYADVTVVCMPVSDADIIVRNPCVVVEVTSPSTARIDRREKLDAYRQMASLRAYLIVDDRRRRVDRHSRDSSGNWIRQQIVAEGIVPVPCVDVELSLDDIYEGVALPAVGEPEPVEYET